MEQKVFLTITRYSKWMAIIGFFSMIFFRFALFLNKNIRFLKLMGTGKNGEFDIRPDWKQWVIFSVHNKSYDDDLDHFKLIKNLYGGFIKWFIKTFSKESVVICLVPFKGHGSWDGNTLFEYADNVEKPDLPIAVITRASIRLQRVRSFWKYVPIVAKAMKQAEGLVFTFSIGEIPWLKQATFSIWKNATAMQTFAYKQTEHKEVIRKTHQEKWYSEEMFVRFHIQFIRGNYLPLKALANNS